MKTRAHGILLFFLVVLPACASLGGLGGVLQPPRLEAAAERTAEIRLLAPSPERPFGGASIRLWAEVENPNPFGLVLSALSGTLALEGTRAAEVDFPLGVPLPAAQDTVIPLDIAVNFADLPGLADVVSRAVTNGSVAYQMNGTIAVDAGLLGQPTFGPTALLQGSIRTR
jgi:hypothetical protein